MKYQFYLLATTLLIALTSTPLFAQQSLFGTITDELGEPVIGANIKISQGDSYLAGTSTDFDGNYAVHLEAGEYSMEFSYVGYTTHRITEVEVTPNEQNNLDFQFEIGREISCYYIIQLQYFK